MYLCLTVIENLVLSRETFYKEIIRVNQEVTMMQNTVPCIILLFAVMIWQTDGQTLEDAKNLTRALLDEYDVRQRPVKDQSRPVYVNVSMDILTIQVCLKRCGYVVVMDINVFQTFHMSC